MRLHLWRPEWLVVAVRRACCCRYQSTPAKMQECEPLNWPMTFSVPVMSDLGSARRWETTSSRLLVSFAYVRTATLLPFRFYEGDESIRTNNSSLLVQKWNTLYSLLTFYNWWKLQIAMPQNRIFRKQSLVGTSIENWVDSKEQSPSWEISKRLGDVMLTDMHCLSHLGIP